MRQLSLQDILKKSFGRGKIFKSKRPLTSSWRPAQLFHRDEQIRKLISILGSALNGQPCRNAFIHGKPGTGKTATILYIKEEVEQISRENGENAKFTYLNCKLSGVSKSPYQLLVSLIRKLGENIPENGLSTKTLYNHFIKYVRSEKKTQVIFLDEIDSLINNNGEDFLYNLMRINEQLKSSFIALIGITNNLFIARQLDPRVRSSLGEENILFPPYNAEQMLTILKARAREAFNPGRVSEVVLKKIAALAAQEHGDARKALDLLRTAGEIAEEEEAEQIDKKHLDNAERRLCSDQLTQFVRSQPEQSQLVLKSIISLHDQQKRVRTKEIIEEYSMIALQRGIKILTERRVFDLIAELEQACIINGEVISKGRYGRSKFITINLNEKLKEKVKKVLKTELQ